MVAVEAAAHGTPTVVFNAGGVSDAVRDGVSGRVVPTHDIIAFYKVVVDVLKGQCSLKPNEICNFAEGFTWDRIGNRICDLLIQTI